ncbi:MAG: hypothetical protein H8E85_06415 [Candidatus Marinimicrobia bacterium]|nr:hypothetical protein [Candidatus Neomarinimicrobiota bacterium]
MKILIIFISSILNLELLGYSESIADTLTIHPITFSTSSPEGWNAQYKTIVQFPNTDVQWAKVLMVQTLKCDSLTAGDKYPCGEWDYIWSTFVDVPNGDTTEQFCLGSFVTPYGKRLELNGENGWEWIYDISEYAPILNGDLNLTVGNNQELLDLKFHFISGVPPRDVIAIENIYQHENYKYEFLADDSLLKEREIILNSKAEGFQIKSIISGHGHEGPRNCCEWDSKTHTWFIDGWQLFRWNVWTDCGNNPIYPQGGTWPFDRAGWCPGAIVDEKLFELTPFVTPGDTISIDYGIQNYYDDGEKEGAFRMTHQLISYGAPNFKNDAELVDIIAPSSQDKYSRINPICDNPQIIIRNSGAVNLQSVKIEYGLTMGKKSVYHWHGDLAFLESDTLILPPIDWRKLKKDPTFEVELSSPNGVKDENIQNNILTSTVVFPLELPTEFILHIHTNNVNRANENSFTISDTEGEVFYSDRDFEDDTDYRYEVTLNKGCYQFLFSDKMEDGISKHWWYRNSNPEKIGINGSVEFLSINGKKLYIFNPDFGQELRLNFVVE